MVAKKTSTKKKAAAPKTVAKKKTTRNTAAKKTVAAAPKYSAAPRIGGWWDNSFSGAGILVALAAVVGIVAFFCSWIGTTEYGIRFVFGGIDLLTIGGDDKTYWFGESWQTIIPLITLLLSIIAFLAALLPAMKVRANQYGIDALVVLCGIIIFILAICFLFGMFGQGVTELLGEKFYQSLDFGFYMTIGASIVMILGGLADALKRY